MPRRATPDAVVNVLQHHDADAGLPRRTWARGLPAGQAALVRGPARGVPAAERVLAPAHALNAPRACFCTPAVRTSSGARAMRTRCSRTRTCTWRPCAWSIYHSYPRLRSSPLTSVVFILGWVASARRQARMPGAGCCAACARCVRRAVRRPTRTAAPGANVSSLCATSNFQGGHAGGAYAGAVGGHWRRPSHAGHLLMTCSAWGPQPSRFWSCLF